MIDDKREKLREYLRNNRPKNSVNLGNSYDDKENSNKNLEKDLNSDNLNLNNNSDLDNSQISDNKINSNKRDYDKEPIIIKSLGATGIYFYAILVAIAMFFLDKKMYDLGILQPNYSSTTLYYVYTSEGFLPRIISMIIFAFAVKLIVKKDLIIINNSYITYNNNYNSKGLDVYTIKYDNFLSRNNLINTNLWHKLCILLVLILVMSFLFKNYEIFYMVAKIPIYIYFPFILMVFMNGGLNYILSFGVLYIKTKNYKKIIPLISKKDRYEIRMYFLEKLGIDIENKIIYLLPQLNKE